MPMWPGLRNGHSRWSCILIQGGRRRENPDPVYKVRLKKTARQRRARLDQKMGQVRKISRSQTHLPESRQNLRQIARFLRTNRHPTRRQGAAALRAASATTAPC